VHERCVLFVGLYTFPTWRQEHCLCITKKKPLKLYRYTAAACCKSPIKQTHCVGRPNGHDGADSVTTGLYKGQHLLQTSSLHVQRVWKVRWSVLTQWQRMQRHRRTQSPASEAHKMRRVSLHFEGPPGLHHLQSFTLARHCSLLKKETEHSRSHQPRYTEPCTVWPWRHDLKQCRHFSQVRKCSHAFVPPPVNLLVAKTLHLKHMLLQTNTYPSTIDMRFTAKQVAANTVSLTAVRFQPKLDSA
jgi:hypothetical protein